MASVKEMRTRIGSVKSTQKITKAMQMVAAAKLRRAQSAAESARPYARQMARVIANLAGGVSGPSAPKLLAGTGFTIEPGIYTKEFGVRTEINMVVGPGDATVTGPIQTVYASPASANWRHTLMQFLFVWISVATFDPATPFFRP